jgi:hypothetical protein
MWTRLVVMKSVVEAPTFCYRCDRAIVFRIETHAKKREAKVYAGLLGYGVSSDAEHISEPDPTGQHPARAMKMAFLRLFRDKPRQLHLGKGPMARAALGTSDSWPARSARRVALQGRRWIAAA